MDRIETKRFLMQCDYEYYNTGETVIPDHEYDKLKDNFIKNFPDDQYCKNVGAPIIPDFWEKARHKIAMGSLEKFNSEEEFSKWVLRVIKEGSSFDIKLAKDFLLQEKLDGISIDLEYVNGELIRAITRGDGIEGDNIYENVIRMENVKPTLPIKITSSLRGEIVLRHADFERINTILENEGEDKKANPRNAASGISRKHDGRFSEYLTILYFDIASDDLNFDFEHEKVDFIYKELGLNCVNYYRGNPKYIIEVFKSYEEEKRSELDYEIDGMVIKSNSIKIQDMMGIHNQRPKAQRAWKFNAPKAITQLENVYLSQEGSSGAVNIMAKLKPVYLMGTTIQRASMHNWNQYQILLGKGLSIGCDVVVIKANDIIPQIEDVKNNTGIVPDLLLICKGCDSELEVQDKFLVCPNKNCKLKEIGTLKKWISCLDIKDIGPSAIEKLYEAGLIREPADFYKLRVSDISILDGLGESSANKMIEHLNSKKRVPLPDFLAGVNMTNFGKSYTKLLMQNGYRNMGDFFQLILGDKEKRIKKLCEIKGIEEKTATFIIDGLRKRSKMLEDLIVIGIRPLGQNELDEIIKRRTQGKLGGKTFCFTGPISRLDENGKRFTRNMMHALVEENGGTVSEKVDKSLNFLVMADPNSTKSKAVTARKIGTVILSEEDFFKELGLIGISPDPKTSTEEDEPNLEL